MGGETKLSGPDLAAGISENEVPADGPLLGQANGESVLLVRNGDEIFAVGATCTHYSGPLAEGRVVDGTIRCPWHHACFDLRTGAVHARAGVQSPALLRRRAGGGENPRRRPARRSDHAAARVVAAHHRHRRRGRGRRVGGRDAAARGIRRRDPPVRRRRVAARRSAQSVEGLPGRHGTRGMDAAAAAVILRRAEDRAGARRPRDGHRSGRQAAVAGGRARGRLGRAPAGDRRRGDPPAAAGRRPAARPHAAHAGRQPRHHRGREPRQARGGARGQLHRDGGGGVAAGARPDRRGRGAGPDPVRALARPRAGRPPARGSRGARRPLPPRPDGDAHRGQRGRAGERRAAQRRSGRPGRGRPAGDRAGSRGRPHHRSRRGGRRSAAHQRTWRVRGRRHRPLPLRADRRIGADRALGGRAEDGAGGGDEHAGARSAVRLATVLLEHAVRRDDQLRRTRRELGSDRHRGRSEQTGRHPRLPPGRPDAGRRHARARPDQPRRRGGLRAQRPGGARTPSAAPAEEP